MFACKASIATSGPGCGGTKACKADKPASAGMPRAITGIFVRRATRRIIGISITTPTSKNSGIPTINALRAMAHGSLCSGAFFSMVSQITSAPPERVRRIPIIPPKAMSNPTPDAVEPTPLVKLVRLLSYGNPAMIAVAIEPIINDRKGCTFTTAISTTISAIPNIAARINPLINPP